MAERIPIPAPGADVLRSLEREASDAEHDAMLASDAATKARARANAVRTALCAALQMPRGRVTLDLKEGCFVVEASNSK